MRRLALLLVAALLVCTTPTPVAAADALTDETSFVDALNRLRASRGLAPFTVDAELTAIGRRWAQQMADAGRISHNPNFAGEVTQDWMKLGENVGTGPDVGSVMDAFEHSPPHLANMVDPEFTRVGVGVVYVDQQLYTSHQFMRLASDDGTPAPRQPRPQTTRAPTTARRSSTTTIEPTAATTTTTAATTTSTTVAVAAGDPGEAARLADLLGRPLGGADPTLAIDGCPGPELGAPIQHWFCA